jgi:hypothetical protein
LRKSKNLPKKENTKANYLMKNVVQIEHSASSSQSKHEGESSFGLCDRLSRTRDNSQRQLPTDQDYAASTREYQTDQSSLKTAPTAARSVLEKRRNQTTTNPNIAQVDTVTPYQANALIELLRSISVFGKWPKNRLFGEAARRQPCVRFGDFFPNGRSNKEKKQTLARIPVLTPKRGLN